jgi:hypothetical protein
VDIGWYFQIDSRLYNDSFQTLNKYIDEIRDLDLLLEPTKAQFLFRNLDPIQ